MSKDRIPRRRPNRTTSGGKPAQGLLSHWRIFVAFLPVAIVAGLAVGAVRSSFFTVQEVRVEGVAALDALELVTASGLLGQSMFDLPKEQARFRLLAEPQVKSVDISRRWPRALLLQVEERQPVAFWSIDGKDYLVDEEGRVLSAGSLPETAPRIIEQPGGRSLTSGDRVHPDAIALALHVVAEPPAVSEQQVVEFIFRDGVGLTFTLSSGLRVTFGDLRSYDYKWAVLEQLLDSLSAQGVSPNRVDLRLGARVIYE